MWKSLRDALFEFRGEGHENLQTPSLQHAEFLLHFGDLEIGTLGLDRGVWTFRYSRAFREQDAVKPLIDFPDTDRVYRSPGLWPFFVHRIPSVAQPQIREAIESEGLDEHNTVQLLARFGKRTISNPFVLEPVEV